MRPWQRGMSVHTLTAWPMPSLTDVPEPEPEPPEVVCEPAALLFAVVAGEAPQPASTAVATAADMRPTSLDVVPAVMGVLPQGSASPSDGDSRNRDRRPIAETERDAADCLRGAT